MTEIEVTVFATGLLLVRLVSMYLVTAVAVKQQNLAQGETARGKRKGSHVQDFTICSCGCNAIQKT